MKCSSTFTLRPYIAPSKCHFLNRMQLVKWQRMGPKQAKRASATHGGSELLTMFSLNVIFCTYPANPIHYIRWVASRNDCIFVHYLLSMLINSPKWNNIFNKLELSDSKLHILQAIARPQALSRTSTHLKLGSAASQNSNLMTLETC